MSQLALPLRLADHAVFDSFHAAGNEALVAMLRALAQGDDGAGCYLWGSSSTGKTHLLQAVCDVAGDESVYLPLAMFAEASPEMLDGLTQRRLICVDDIEAVAGDKHWETALFALYNEATANRCALVVAASQAPRSSEFRLADLKSRLGQLPTYQLEALGDSDTQRALQLRARHRGLDLPDDTAQFLLNRSRRDMASLYELLDKLDSEALRAQRRLTIPFVKDVLASQ